MGYFIESFFYHFSFFIFIGIAVSFGMWAFAADKKLLKFLFLIIAIAALLMVAGRIISSFDGVDSLGKFFMWTREHITGVF